MRGRSRPPALVAEGHRRRRARRARRECEMRVRLRRRTRRRGGRTVRRRRRPAASSASSAASTTTRSGSRSAGSMTANAVLRRRIGSRTHQRRPPRTLRRGRARLRGEGRPSRRAAGPRRSRCPRSVAPRALRRPGERLPALPRPAGITESSAAARTVGSRSSRSADEHALAGGDDPARAERGRRRAPLGRVGGAGEVGRERAAASAAA